jgi:hypothetical protein
VAAAKRRRAAMAAAEARLLWARERGREREEVEKRGTMTQRRRRRRNFDKRGERTHRLLSAIGVFSFAMLLLLLLEEDARAGTAATGRVESTRKGGIFGLRSRVGVFFSFFFEVWRGFFFSDRADHEPGERENRSEIGSEIEQKIRKIEGLWRALSSTQKALFSLSLKQLARGVSLFHP